MFLCGVHKQEGEAFLKSQGMEVASDVDAKTRSQKEKLDEITSPQEGKDGEENGDGGGEGGSVPKLSREGTMAVTAKVRCKTYCIHAISQCLKYFFAISPFVD